MASVKVHSGNREAVVAATKWINRNGDHNLWFYGSPGTGKTHLASAAVSDGPIGSVQFHSVPEILLHFQGGVKEHDELELIKAYWSGNQIRVFDDIGAHRISEFAIEMFGLLLGRFYDHNVAGLIFTSNLSPRDLLDVMGERVSSRLRGLAEPIKLEGHDWRIRESKA